MIVARPRGGPRVSSWAVTPAFPPVPLERVAASVPGASVRDGDGVLVSDAMLDPETVAPGGVFFCVRGARADGHAFARAAIASGAAAVVVERWLDVEAPQVLVPSVRRAMGPMAAEVFGRPAAAMRTVGVTGTNGKTTVTHLMGSIFDAAGWTFGVIGTIGGLLAGEPVALDRTTPEAPELQRLLARMRAREVRAVAMEVSSHALAQHRVDGIVFDVTVFTNLSRDHLDYHGSMDRYLAEKAKLFTPTATRRSAVNVDDDAGRTLLDTGIPVTTFAIDREADLRAVDVEVSRDGLAFVADGLRLRTGLHGAFNVWNVLAAVAAARLVGVGDDAIVAGVAAAPHVPGRMQPVDAGQGFLVFVDYAHTPEGIESVLGAARALAAGRLIVVFGCGGERDHAKRPLMGDAATSAADLAVITTDNPRSEDPLAIIAEIEPGAKRGGGAFVVEPDRRAAIRLALTEARRGDVVVIAGKGHEPYQELAAASVPFDDRAVAREELDSLGGGP